LQPAFPPFLLSYDGTALVAARSTPGANHPPQFAVWQLDGGTSTELPGETAMVPVQLTSGGNDLLAVNAAAKQLELRRWSPADRRSTVVQSLPLPENFAPDPAAATWVASRDLKWLACREQLGRVDVRQLGLSGAKPVSFTGLAATTLAFSPRLNLLAVAQNDGRGAGSVTFWQPGDPVTKAASVKLASAPLAIAWSPDGSALAVAGEDHTVQLCDPNTRRLVRELAGHKHAVTAVAFAPDGRTLASGDGRTIKLWHAATGRELFTLFRDLQFGESLLWLAFTPDATRLLAGDGVGRLTTYFAPPLAEADAPR